MCGLAGFVGHGDRNDLGAMTAALVHRGPDGAGSYHDPAARVYLGHRRLAIIDVADGAQPMWDAQGDTGVVYNGEIYNHKELRKTLEQRGHVFATDHSDTEVLIHGYREWGVALPEHLHGMFAFCIYDRRRRQLFLARDRFGEKPLYFAQQGGTFFFASELSAISRHRAFQASLSRRSLQKFFAYGFIPAPNAIWEDCEKLPGGCSLIFDIQSQTVTQHRYWSFRLEPDLSWRSRPEGELVEELRALLLQAVSRRLISDAPLGFFLSGGVDSSAVLAAARRLSPGEELKAYTLGFNEPSFDESAHARQVAQALGARHAVDRLDLSTARNCALDSLARLDEPSGDASILPTALLARFARKEVKVALSGDGADELFAGYDPFLALAPSRLYQAFAPRPLHALLRAAAMRLPASNRNMSLDFKLQRTLSGLSHPPALWNPVWLAPADPDFIKDLFEEPLTPEALYSEALSLWEARDKASTVERTLEFYTNYYLQDGILNKVDRATMMSSLESRAVFLDNDIVDFCQKLPEAFKLRGRRRKYILKQALRGLVPPSVTRRRKKGFGVPTASWLRSLPKDPPLAPVDGVRMPTVAKAWRDHRSGAADHRLFLWSWLSLQTFASGFVRPDRQLSQNAANSGDRDNPGEGDIR
jgi:asparagine synthase (glutamine-hydrolysing)